MKQQFELLATYNKWMNEKLYQAASKLSDDEIAKERGAFFGSILGTLNHLMVGDTLWLSRFAGHPASAAALQQVADLPRPASLDQILFWNFSELRERRVWLDEQILQWIAGVPEADFDAVLQYKNLKGVATGRKLSDLVLHFFNHQTHHRGQATTLLTQAGQDVGVTDLLYLVPEVPAT